MWAGQEVVDVAVEGEGGRVLRAHDARPAGGDGL